MPRLIAVTLAQSVVPCKNDAQTVVARIKWRDRAVLGATPQNRPGPWPYGSENSATTGA